jgi:aryl-alcohol dehydrogenase-like predicted oxidoreductase
MTKAQPDIRLGLGLIGIGRPWGFKKSPIPDEKTVLAFLRYAYDLGITFFDTAVSYGLSEERFGKFLRTLGPGERDRITVATKFGDHWNAAEQTAFADHSFTMLQSSLDRSLKRLGKIDIVQLHRPNPAALRSDDVHRAFDYAVKQGITILGVSVSETESGNIACQDDRYRVIQLPYNNANKKLETIIDQATEKEKMVLINRPYNMGETIYSGDASPDDLRTRAYRLIVGKKFRGYILTGTTSAVHLKENWESFRKAVATN